MLHQFRLVFFSTNIEILLVYVSAVLHAWNYIRMLDHMHVNILLFFFVHFQWKLMTLIAEVSLDSMCTKITKSCFVDLEKEILLQTIYHIPSRPLLSINC